MTAKLTLIGQPQSIYTDKDCVMFTIVTGPASSTTPKGLPMFKAATYIAVLATSVQPRTVG